MNVKNGRHDRNVRFDVETKNKASNSTFGWAGGVTSHYVSQPGMFYYEARVIVADDNGIARLGWSWHRSLESRRILGEDSYSVGYGGTGFSSFEKRFIRYGTPFSDGDIIGCYVEIDPTPKFWFSKNGVTLGRVETNFVTLPSQFLVTPAYALKHASVEFNFGEHAFSFPPTGGYRGVATVAISREGLPPGMSISRMLAETRLDTDNSPPTKIIPETVLTKRDDNDNTLLHLAVYDEKYSAVLQYLKSMAMLPADAKWRLLRLRNSMKRSPLHTATVNEVDISIALLLVKAGFPLRDKGTLDVLHKTPIDYVRLVPWHRALLESAEDRRHFAEFLAGSGLLTLRVKKPKVTTPYHPGSIEPHVWGKRRGSNQVPKVWSSSRDWAQAKNKKWHKWTCCQGPATAPPCCIGEETPAVAVSAEAEAELEYICPPAMHAVLCNPNLRVEIVRFV